MTTASHPSVPVHRLIDTRLGRYVLAADGEDLVGLWREGQLRFPAAERMGGPAEGPHALLDRAEQQLHEYLAGERPTVLGEATHEVLSEKLGLSQAELGRFCDSGVLNS